MDTFAELKDAGKKRFGDLGAWAFDEWKKLNKTYFNGENSAGQILWGLTPDNRSMGYYSGTDNLIYLHKTMVRPQYPKSTLKMDISDLNRKLASDVLLHEMIHQRIHQTGGWVGDTSHNNERFVGEVNRIAKLLGLNIIAKVIKSKNVDGKLKKYVEPGCLTYKELYEFPYSSRPGDFYHRQS